MSKQNLGAAPAFKTGKWAAAIALAFGSVQPAFAAAINLGIPDVSWRWDNTIRYNLGIRAENIDDRFGDNPTYDETDYQAKQGDIVTNRLDWISETDIVYQGRHGIRLSGAAWYDAAYDKHASTHPGDYTDPATGAVIPYSEIGSYVDNKYSGQSERFHRGPSAELLDAFAFTSFRLGNVEVNLKAGQHTVYWGESLFTTFHGIAYSQEPIDGLKASTSPGIEAKEVFRPINQISFQAQLNDTLSIAGQYFLDWKPNRLPEGGTYFGSADMLFDGPDRLYLYTLPAGAIPGTTSPTPVFANRNKNVEPGNTGNWGLNLRWNPEWANGPIGIYYRVFDETQPWAPVLSIDAATLTPNGYHLNYAQDTRLVGLSYSTTVGLVSVGSEVSYRHDAALNSTSSFAAAGDFAGNGDGARGNTLHALVNGIYLLPATPLWTGGTLQGEVIYSHLFDVTENKELYNGKGYACDGSTKEGCSTDNVYLAQIGFTPEWPQAFAGWDLSMPTSFSYGIHGNGATLGGGNQGAYTYSIGVGAKLYAVHEFSLKYNDSHNDFTVDKALGVVAAVNGNAAQNDHGWVSFTYKFVF